MKTFKDLKHNPHPNRDGTQAVMYFNNGYGVSVIKSPNSYGGPEGLYEMAVKLGNKDKNSLCYNTPITDDVLGSLTEDEVTRYMKEVQELE